MLNKKVSIFRSEALKRYMSRNEKTIFPKIIAPRTFLYLWLILALLLVAALCALLADIPVYASALALVVEDGNRKQNSSEVKIALLLPPENLPQLQVNQTVFFRRDKVGPLVSRQINDVEPAILSPSAIRSRFGLSGDAATKVDESSVVAFISLEPLPHGMEASSYLGTSYNAQVEIGHRRLASFLPVVGRLFSGRSP